MIFLRFFGVSAIRVCYDGSFFGLSPLDDFGDAGLLAVHPFLPPALSYHFSRLAGESITRFFC